MKKVFKILLVAGMLITLLCCLGWWMLNERWEYILSSASPQESYAVAKPADDTLRVLMIGDSWAGMHHENNCDTELQGMLEAKTGSPVVAESRGRGGAKSKEVYHLMFNDATPSADRQKGYCLQPMLQQGAHYCIVMAGINDAAACLGTRYYCENYKLIIDFLLDAGMTPVVVEMPFVNIEGLYGGKPLKDKAMDWLRSVMTGCSMYDVTVYSRYLISLIGDSGLADSVLLVRKEQWNPLGVNDVQHLYLDDGIHLNAKGYELLDSCLAEAIAADWAIRH